MIRLHQFAPAFGLPNASPFCLKVETWLRLAGLPYEAVNDGNVFKAPKGKLPYIVDNDGTVVADSSAIVLHLTRRHGIALDAHLTAEEQAQALAFQRLFEENLYWAVVHTRWFTAEGWPKTRQAFFGTLPGPLRWAVALLARRGMRAEMQGHGMGRHTPQEIMAIGCRDVSAVAAFLGDKPFMMGRQPCTLDAVAFAFLANLLWAPVASDLQRCAQQHPALEGFCRRMKARCFG